MSYPEIDERLKKHLDDYTFIAAYKAIDGTLFYGDQDDVFDKFKEHNKKIIKNLESEMVGNVSIYEAGFFFNGTVNAFVKFHNPKGKIQFKTWCKYNKISLKNTDYIDTILELDKWYAVNCVDKDLYELRTTSLDEYITNLNNLQYKLNSFDNKEVFV